MSTTAIDWNNTIDFGTYPGLSHTTLTVSAPGIKAGSMVTAQVLRRSTSDHSEDEHTLERIKVSAGDIVEGVSFTVHAVYDGEQMDPTPGSAQPMLTGVWNVGGRYTT